MDAAGASPLLRRHPLSAGAPSFPPFSDHRRTPIANLRFRRPPLEPKAATSSFEPQAAAAPVSPVYRPTPSDRELRTPHSGYHFDGTARVFFEGWYFKVSIPQCRQSFCFMYSMENPAFSEGMGMLESSIYGHRFTGVGAQILGADDKYICQFTEQSKNFWGSKHELMLGNTFTAGNNLTPPTGELPPQETCSLTILQKDQPSSDDTWLCKEDIYKIAPDLVTDYLSSNSSGKSSLRFGRTDAAPLQDSSKGPLTSARTRAQLQF